MPESRLERSSLLEQFRNLMHNVQQNRRLQIRPFGAVRILFLYSPSLKMDLEDLDFMPFKQKKNGLKWGKKA